MFKRAGDPALLFYKQSVMNLYLIGFMGAGKSTVAEALAKILKREIKDIDSLVVEKTGMPILDIFEQHGESYFRDLETVALKETDSARNLVVATGGGCVERPENLEQMKKTGTTVYLRASWDDIVDRIADCSHRPLANADDDWNETRARYLKRLPLYETADITIDTSGKSPAAIANEIVDRLSLQA